MSALRAIIRSEALPPPRIVATTPVPAIPVQGIPSSSSLALINADVAFSEKESSGWACRYRLSAIVRGSRSAASRRMSDSNIPAKDTQIRLNGSGPGKRSSRQLQDRRIHVSGSLRQCQFAAHGGRIISFGSDSLHLRRFLQRRGRCQLRKEKAAIAGHATA